MAGRPVRLRRSKATTRSPVNRARCYHKSTRIQFVPHSNARHYNVDISTDRSGITKQSHPLEPRRILDHEGVALWLQLRVRVIPPPLSPNISNALVTDSQEETRNPCCRSDSTPPSAHLHESDWQCSRYADASSQIPLPTSWLLAPHAA